MESATNSPIVNHSGLAPAVERFVSGFAQAQQAWADQPPWLKQRRERAIERFVAAGIPTVRDEEWRFTNLAPLSEQAFALPNGAPADLDRGCLDPYVIDGCQLLVIVDGRYSAELSDLGQAADLSAQPEVSALSQLDAAASGDASRAFSQEAARANPGRGAWSELNAAMARDEFLIRLAPDVIAERPIQLLFVVTSDAVAVHPRVCIVAGRGSQAAVIESYASLGGGSYLTNATTHVVLDDNAQLDHYKLQQECNSAFHLATIQAEQQRGSRFRSHSFSFGGRIARNEINSLLTAESCECTFNGLFIADKEQLVDHHTAIDHASANCNSYELYKGVLDGRARGVFNGKILVRPDAQQTNAFQNNRNLLLSDTATINTKPQLEIWADDVRCSHGATIGQLEDDSLFYLCSRGIGRADAQSMLVRAFAGEVVDHIRLDALQRYVAELINQRFSVAQGNL